MIQGSRHMSARPAFLIGPIWTLAACTGPNPDYNQNAACVAGDRACVKSGTRPTYPVVCGQDADGGLTLEDERCPQAAACQDGLCTAPSGAHGCKSQGACAKGEVCVPLVVPSGSDPKTIGEFCLPAASAQAAPEQRCSRDDDCQSYLCLPFQAGTYCLKACASNTDCPIPDLCQTLNVTITGISGEIKSCSPAH